MPILSTWSNRTALVGSMTIMAFVPKGAQALWGLLHGMRPSERPDMSTLADVGSYPTITIDHTLPETIESQSIFSGPEAP